VIHVRRFMLLLVDVECFASAMEVKLNSWVQGGRESCVSDVQKTNEHLRDANIPSELTLATLS
jgi:hypothetical protein